MIVVRPVELRDEEALERLSLIMGQGITSLPRNPQGWQKKISRSLASFENPSLSPDSLYLFVLENGKEQSLLGTCQIVASTAGSTQGHYYNLDSLTLPKTRLGDPSRIPLLKPVHHKTESTEIGGLFLDPAARQKGLSRLLSLSRFLFIAAHRSLFHRTIIAEIRGHIENGASPFWNAVGRHFVDIEFEELMRQLHSNADFLPSIIAPFPILVTLLPPPIQVLIGKAHKLSQTALNRLLNEGFTFSGDVDLFDAGPKVSASVDAIKTVQQHKTGVIKSIHNPHPGRHSNHVQYLICNRSLAFRACLAHLEITTDGIALAPEVAHALQVKCGDSVLYVVSGKSDSKSIPQMQLEHKRK